MPKMFSDEAARAIDEKLTQLQSSANAAVGQTRQVKIVMNLDAPLWTDERIHTELGSKRLVNGAFAAALVTRMRDEYESKLSEQAERIADLEAVTRANHHVMAHN